MTWLLVALVAAAGSVTFTLVARAVRRAPRDPVLASLRGRVDEARRAEKTR